MDRYRAAARLCLYTLIGIPTLASATVATLHWNGKHGARRRRVQGVPRTRPGAYGSPIDVGNVTTFIDPYGLSDLTTYYYAVTAYNATSESERSNEASFLNHPPVISFSIAPRSGRAPSSFV